MTATLVFAPMPRLKPLDDAVQDTGLGRRTLQRWLSEGILTAYKIAGDKRRYVDVEEIEKLRQPQPLPKRDGGQHGGKTRPR